MNYKNLAILLCLYLSGCQMGIGQPYISKMIETPFGATSVHCPHEAFGDIYLGGIFARETVVMRLDPLSFEYDYFTIDSFSICHNGLNFSSERLHLFGSDRHFAESMQIRIYDPSGNLQEVRAVPGQGLSHRVFFTLGTGSAIYCGFNTTIEDRIVGGISKIDTNNQILWTRYYEDDSDWYTLCHMTESSDGNLLVSYTISGLNVNGDLSAALMKIDTSGAVIWRSEKMIDVHGGATDVDIAQLSDGKIALQYEMDKFLDPEYFGTYIPFTPAMYILDEDGEVLSVSVHKLPYHRESDIITLEEGKGDYYFALGLMYDHDDVYAAVTKHDNSGDTIWTKRYHHQDYDTAGIYHIALYLLEEDNGDLLIGGRVRPPGQADQPWLFRVNSEGCFSEEDCEEEVQVLVSTDDKVVIVEEKVTISPNPSREEVIISSAQPYESITIYDGQGVRVKTMPYQSRLSIREVPVGIYYLKLSDTTGWGPMIKGVKI